MSQEGMLELIQEATEMLQDRSKKEQDLIYYVAKMDSDLRTAIVLAYQRLREEGGEKQNERSGACSDN